MDISKTDWKLFRERLKEYANFLNDDKKTIFVINIVY